MNLCTSEEMREIDRITIQDRDISGLELMEQAGTAIVDLIEDKLAPSNIVIVAGKGNNGGDGYVAARLLAEKDYNVKVILLASTEETKGDALTNFNRIPPAVSKITPSNAQECEKIFNECDLIIDAILGTGVKGPATGIIAGVIDAINKSGKPVISADIPSGLPGSGEIPEGPVVHAHFTVTMGLSKLGMEIFPGVEYTGERIIAPLSFPEDLLCSPLLKHKLTDIEMVNSYLPDREPDGNKHTFGYVFIAAGSEGMTGAAILAGSAAVRSGAGLVYVGVPKALMPIVESNLIEAVKIPITAGNGTSFDNHSTSKILAAAEKVDAVAIGPGIGTNPYTKELIQNITPKIQKPLVIDADGLNAIAEKPEVLLKRKEETVLTPHPGEMARLLKKKTEDIQKNRIAAARELSNKYKVITVLKGARTIVADPDGTVFINPTGNSSLAKGGSGDVLTGLITGLIAQGLTPIHAAVAGVFIHGLAADLAEEDMNERYISPIDIISYLSPAFDIVTE